MSTKDQRNAERLRELTDAQGRRVILGKEITRGGEGSIHLVEGQPDRLAKIYLRAPDATKLTKIKIMTTQSWGDSLRAVVAMPTALLSGAQGAVCGLLMPYLAGHLSSEQLTLASGRRANFPHADWHFLAHVAKNLAAAVEVVHQSGLIIGDLNDGSYLIKRATGTVGLVDADSFQLTTPLGTYRCEVAKPLFTAPELHHVDFTTCVRSIDHDNFALAILIFQLLFLGRHPFAGRPLTDQEITPERAVEELRFAYGRDAARRGIERPPNILGLDALTPNLAEMFERAFSPAGRQPGARPNAGMWRQALEQQQQQMRVCPDNQAHKFTRTLAACPWCAIEQKSHAVLFACLIHVQTMSGQLSADLQTLLHEVETFAVMPLMPNPPQIAVQAKATAMPADFIRQQRQTQLRQGLLLGLGLILAFILPMHLGIVLCMLLAGGIMITRPRHLLLELDRCQAAAQEALAETTLLDLRWQIEASGAHIHKRKQELMQQVAEWRGLETAKQPDAATIEARARAQQRADHLDRCILQTADIPGLAAGRKAILISYGIPSAGQVDPVVLAQVPGLSGEMAQALMAWRASCEQRFVFDTTYSRQDIRDAIANEASERRQSLAERLVSGHALLRAQAHDAMTQRQVISNALEQAQIKQAQAIAQLAAIMRLCRFPFLPAR